MKETPCTLSTPTPLSLSCSLKGSMPKQAEAIVSVVSRSDSGLVTKADLDAAISTAVNKMMVSQGAVAGLLFAAIKLFS